MQQLEECGLRAFEIDSPHVFWEKIVNPTWVAGSTIVTGGKLYSGPWEQIFYGEFDSWRRGADKDHRGINSVTPPLLG